MKWYELFGNKNVNLEDEIDASVLDEEKPIEEDIKKQKEQDPEDKEQDPEDKGKENTQAIKELTSEIKKLQESNRELAILGQAGEKESFDDALLSVVGYRRKEKN